MTESGNRRLSKDIDGPFHVPAAGPLVDGPEALAAQWHPVRIAEEHAAGQAQIRRGAFELRGRRIGIVQGESRQGGETTRRFTNDGGERVVYDDSELDRALRIFDQGARVP